MADGLKQELPGRTGQGTAKKTAGQPATAISRGCSPSPGQQERADGQRKLIPAAMNPRGEGNQENGYAQAYRTGLALAQPRPHQNEQKKNRDRDQKWPAQMQA